MLKKHQDFYELLYHIVNHPNSTHPDEIFNIENNIIEYGTTKIKRDTKEHKFWTPKKNSRYRCYMIIQRIGNILRVQHVLDSVVEQPMIFDVLHKHVQKTNTLATACRAKDQFKSSIEIEIPNSSNMDDWIDKIYNYISSITKMVIENRLNSSKRGKLKI